MSHTPGLVGWLRALPLAGLLVAGAPPIVDARDDWQLWLEQKWSVKLTDRVKAMGRSDLRFRNDMGDFYKQTDNIGLSIKMAPWLKVEPVYQYEWSEQATGGDTTIENRLYLNVTPSVSWRRLHLEDRHRVEFRHLNGRDDWRYRNKPKLSAALGREWYEVEPYVADEVFYGARAGEWNRNRIFVGLEKDLSRHLSADLYYMIESNKTGRDWAELHVLGGTASWRF